MIKKKLQIIAQIWWGDARCAQQYCWCTQHLMWKDKNILPLKANFPIWSPFANLFPKWGRFERIYAMVLFYTWFAWILHAKCNLHWRLRGQWTRGWQPAAAAGEFWWKSVLPVKLAISSLCWNRSFDWQFPRATSSRVAGLCRTQCSWFFGFLGLGESCHLVWRFAHMEIVHSNGDLHLLGLYIPAQCL